MLKGANMFTEKPGYFGPTQNQNRVKKPVPMRSESSCVIDVANPLKMNTSSWRPNTTILW